MRHQEILTARTEFAGSAPANSVLTSLMLRANREGLAWPSQSTLAAETGLSPATVKRTLAELRRAGEIAPEGFGPGGVVIYALARARLSLSPPDQTDPAQPEPGGSDRSGGGLRLSGAPAQAERRIVNESSNSLPPGGDARARAAGGDPDPDREGTPRSAAEALRAAGAAASSPRRTCPEGWRPSAERLAWAERELGLTALAARTHAAEFADFWSGQRRRSADWGAVWAAKILADAPRLGGGAGPARGAPTQGVVERLRHLARAVGEAGGEAVGEEEPATVLRMDAYRPAREIEG